jgi:ATP-dependent DNA helicase PIF1
MEIELTEKQLLALEYLKEGRNVFLTGPGGSGKSFIIKYYVNWFQLYKENDNCKIYITSTTGLSAILIDGITIHRWAGIGIGNKDEDYYYKMIIKNNFLKKKWLHTHTLIIDEISMMNPNLLDKLEILARKIRKSNKPFGGIQIILSGDFLQLPPVNSNLFCFEAENWKLIDNTIYFDKIIRQNDVKLQNILNKIRIGIIDEYVIETLNSCLDRELNNKENIIPTLLFSRKDMVLDYNFKELNKLKDEGKEFYDYNATYVYGKGIKNESKEMYKDLINKHYQIEDNLTFTLYSQVMLIINIPEENLANGSRGIIVDFTKNTNPPLPIVYFLNGKKMVIKVHNFILEDGKLIIVKNQLPLILSWAITIHKAQGMTLDFVKTDIGNSIFEYGQAYVVLSRIKNLEGLSLINIDYSKIKAHPKVIEYYSNINT